MNTDVRFTGVVSLRVAAFYDELVLKQISQEAAAERNVDVPDGYVAVLLENTLGDVVVCASVKVLKNSFDRFEVPIPIPLLGNVEDG